MDVEFDLLLGIVRVDEFSFSNHRCTHIAIASFQDGHARRLLNAALVCVEYRCDFWALTDDFVEDVDLIINRDTTILAKALDTVGDLTGLALTLELRSNLCVEHDCRSSL